MGSPEGMPSYDVARRRSTILGVDPTGCDDCPRSPPGPNGFRVTVLKLLFIVGTMVSALAAGLVAARRSSLSHQLADRLVERVGRIPAYVAIVVVGSVVTFGFFLVAGLVVGHFGSVDPKP